MNIIIKPRSHNWYCEYSQYPLFGKWALIIQKEWDQQDKQRLVTWRIEINRREKSDDD